MPAEPITTKNKGNCYFLSGEQRTATLPAGSPLPCGGASDELGSRSNPPPPTHTRTPSRTARATIQATCHVGASRSFRNGGGGWSAV